MRQHSIRCALMRGGTTKGSGSIDKAANFVCQMPAKKE
jgi:hypothetical protein